MRDTEDRRKSIKCLVWDLDNTLWDGVLLEDGQVTLRDAAQVAVRALDQRGILQSVASKNDPEAAARKLQEFGLWDCFLYPQIGWGSKVPRIKSIAAAINIGLDALAFIDDQAHEREEVRFSLPEVLCLDAAEVDRLLDLPQMNPRFITEDAAHRRQMYLGEMARSEAEESFHGPKEEFLASLDMVLGMVPAREDDLTRAEELTRRTNQLNATGYTYSHTELDWFRRSPQHLLLMAQLEDRFGSYGHVGLALVDCTDGAWTIKLLLTSCRVMGKGVGTSMLTHIMNLAKARKKRLRAELVPTGRNRMMEVTYRFMGFQETVRIDQVVILEHELAEVPSFPPYLKVKAVDWHSLSPV